MNKCISLLGAALLISSSAALASAQIGTTTTTTVTTPTTVTKTTQNADGTYTVVEYPVGRETIVNLSPVTITGAKGVATILRDDNGTRIKLNLTGVPNNVTALNLYAVDPAGVVTSLGPITVTNGLGTFETTTPLNRFMLVASPETTLTTYDPNTRVFFRSAAPEGFAVIPHTIVPLGENVGATAVATTEASTYTVPMLNIPAYKRGDDTKLKLNFTGEMSGARANVFIQPHRGKATQVKMVFHELKQAPVGRTYILWAVSPDNQFEKLGQIVNLKNRNEAEIKARTMLPDFGLLVTLEDIGVIKNTVLVPAGPRLGVIEIIR
ncbi:MAG: hypothetical protein H0U60_03515 [Blastocatellia bacterium]|nr:hypothetical protein [Blastocatellia bacterium]